MQVPSIRGLCPHRPQLQFRSVRTQTEVKVKDVNFSLQLKYKVSEHHQTSNLELLTSNHDYYE